MTDPSPPEPTPAPASPPATPVAKPAAAPGVPPASAGQAPKPPSASPTKPAAAPPGPVASAAKPAPAPLAPSPPTPSAPTQSAPSLPAPPRSAVPVLTAIGFIFVLLAVVWVWNNQMKLEQQVAMLSVVPPPPPAPPPSVAPARVAALEAQVKSLEQRLAEAESRPPPPAAPTTPPPDNSAAIAAQVAAQMATQMAAVEARLKDDEQRQATLAARAASAERLQQAATALDAGQPLGDLPGAPPALAKFAKAKPPTEAALRLAFPAAASAAAEASRPANDGKSLGERILMHASTLLTVKQGNTIVVGAPATAVLAAAEARLEAGDLAGALATLDGLDSAAARAISEWRGDAQALLDARSALAKMAKS